MKQIRHRASISQRELRREAGTILHIALPLTAAYIAEMGMVITDMIIVGRLGSDELAAVGLAGDLFWIFLLIGMGVVSIVGVFAAQSLGAGDRRGVIASCEQGMLAATVTSVPVMLGVWFLGPVLGLARQDPGVVLLVNDYARVITWAVLPALWFVVLRNYVTALARSAAIGWITLAALGLNLALNYTLVFGRLGFPALGVEGAAIGTTLVNWAMFFTLVAYLRRAPALAGYRPALIPRRIDRDMLRELFGLGIPVALTQILNGGMFSAAAVLMGIISATTLAAQQIIYSVVYLALSAAAAFGDAVRVRVAYAIGRGDVLAARRSTVISSTLAFCTTLGAALLLWFVPGLLVGIFLKTGNSESREVLRIALGLSGAAGLFLLLDGTQLVLANALRGLRDTRSPLWISLAGYWLLGLGSGALLCFVFEFGASGLWWGLIAGVALCNLLLVLRLRHRIGAAEEAIQNGKTRGEPII